MVLKVFGNKAIPKAGSSIPTLDSSYQSITSVLFIAAFPYLWSDKKYWYKPLNDMPWDVILPFVNEYNQKRRNPLHVLFLLLDKSMSDFCPKSTKTGDLPNLSHKPRKLVSLGTMF